MMNPYRFKNILQFKTDGLITYIMSDSFRIHYNHGLTKAIELSEEKNVDLQIILLRLSILKRALVVLKEKRSKKQMTARLLKRRLKRRRASAHFA